MGKRARRTKARPCKGEKQYPTQAAAEAARRTYIIHVGSLSDGMRAYSCEHCGKWHVGRGDARHR
jgi:hypothetical protein